MIQDYDLWVKVSHWEKYLKYISRFEQQQSFLLQ